MISSTPATHRTNPAPAHPDAQRLQLQLAELAEVTTGSRSALSLLQHLRTLLAARSVAFLSPPGAPNPEHTVAGAELPGLARLPEVLDTSKAQVLPAPSL